MRSLRRLEPIYQNKTHSLIATKAVKTKEKSESKINMSKF